MTAAAQDCTDRSYPDHSYRSFIRRSLASLTLPEILAFALTACLLLPLSQNAHGQGCADLADLRIDDTNLLLATVVPASDDLPEYCRVLGYVRPAINFEVRLPTDDWNSKFYMAGCWGFCGTLVAAPNFIHGINRGLERGYAVSTMDTGHWETMSSTADGPIVTGRRRLTSGTVPSMKPSA